MHNIQAERFDQAASALGRAAQQLLCAVSEHCREQAMEIRLRLGSAAVLSLPSGPVVVNSGTVTRQIIDDAVLNLCGHSLYSHQQELASGFISLPGGHRAGVCGKAVVTGGAVSAVCDVTAICVRIAREHAGCGDRLLADTANGSQSLIVAGAPGSGKTSILRDLAFSLAAGRSGRRLNVSVVDERGEISLGGTGSLCGLCDVLRFYPKAEGIEHALRSLAPDVIVCDEIGSERDLAAVSSGISAGVKLICSVHAGSGAELAERPVSRRLLDMNAFDCFAVLSGRGSPGHISGEVGS